MPRDANDRWAPEPIAAGVVKLDYLGEGWYQVGVGRARGSKRFNLSDAEARQLVTLFAARGITAEPTPGQVTVKSG